MEIQTPPQLRNMQGKHRSGPVSFRRKLKGIALITTGVLGIGALGLGAAYTGVSTLTPPAKAATGLQTTCSYGTSGPDASNLCWVDLTGLDASSMNTAQGGIPITVTMPNGNIFKAVIGSGGMSTPAPSPSTSSSIISGTLSTPYVTGNSLTSVPYYPTFTPLPAIGTDSYNGVSGSPNIVGGTTGSVQPNGPFGPTNPTGNNSSVWQNQVNLDLSSITVSGPTGDSIPAYKVGTASTMQSEIGGTDATVGELTLGQSLSLVSDGQTSIIGSALSAQDTQQGCTPNSPASLFSPLSSAMSSPTLSDLAAITPLIASPILGPQLANNGYITDCQYSPQLAKTVPSPVETNYVTESTSPTYVALVADSQAYIDGTDMTQTQVTSTSVAFAIDAAPDAATGTSPSTPAAQSPTPTPSTTPTVLPAIPATTPTPTATPTVSPSLAFTGTNTGLIAGAAGLAVGFIALGGFTVWRKRKN